MSTRAECVCARCNVTPHACVDGCGWVGAMPADDAPTGNIPYQCWQQSVIMLVLV